MMIKPEIKMRSMFSHCFTYFIDIYNFHYFKNFNKNSIIVLLLILSYFFSVPSKSHSGQKVLTSPDIITCINHVGSIELNSCLYRDYHMVTKFSDSDNGGKRYSPNVGSNNIVASGELLGQDNTMANIPLDVYKKTNGDTTPPETKLEAYDGNSSVISDSDTVRTREVIFTFTGNDDVTPSSNLEYSYWLMGYDEEKDWSPYTSDKSKTYQDLPDGTYRFRVKAKDETGNEDQEPSFRIFTVELQRDIEIPPEIIEKGLNFEDVVVGTSSFSTITISSEGVGSLSLRCTLSDNEHFTVTPTSLSIDPDETEDLKVTFIPDSLKIYSAELAILSDAVEPNDEIIISITGKGIAPVISASADTLDFGKVEIGSSDTLKFFIRNIGTADLTVSNVSSYLPFSIPLATFPLQIEPEDSLQILITFEPTTRGATTKKIIILSDDPNNETLSLMLKGEGLDLLSPQIKTEFPDKTVEFNTSPNIRALFSDDVGLESAYLFYRIGGTAQWDSVMMNLVTWDIQGDTYGGSIPQSAVTNRGLEYYIKASDGSNIVISPVNPEVNPYILQVKVPRLERPTFQPWGSSQNAYRMISFPLVLDDSSPNSVFLDDLWDYDQSRWRLFQRGNGEWSEYPNVENIVPSKVYWLIVRDRGIKIDVGSGKSLSTKRNFELKLSPGWNEIGLPFNFKVDWNEVEIETNAVINGPFTYEGEWIDPSEIYLLEPWEGYSIMNLDSVEVNISIPPKEFQSLNKKSLPNDYIEWRVRIVTQCQEAKDRINFLGVSKEASLEWDNLDLVEPIGIGEYVSLYFDHRDWVKYPGKYTADYRPISKKEITWDFKVETNISKSTISLGFEDINSIPDEYKVILFDQITLRTVDLRQEKMYKFTLMDNETTRDFRFIITTDNFMLTLPQSFKLHLTSYPNPFNMETTVEYQIPNDCFVELSIFNIMGQKVKELVQGFHYSGNYYITWDGKDNTGNNLSSGIYFCKMRAGSTVISKKLLLLR